MAVVLAFLLVARIAGAAKEMAVAWRFGVGAQVDAYLFVLNIVNWPVAVWFSVLSVVVIPLDARIRNSNAVDLRRFRAELLGFTLLVGMTLAVLSLVLLPSLLRSRWLGLTPTTAVLAQSLVPVLAWLTPAGLLVGLYSVWTMSAGRHTNSLFEGMPALAIFVTLLLTGRFEALAWATLAGTLAQTAALAMPLNRGERRGAPAFRLSSPQWDPFWQSFGIMMLSQAIMSATTLVDQFFGARLGEGAISTLGYSGRVLALVLSLGATAVTRATLPVFSRATAAGASDVRRLAWRWSAFMTGFGVVAGALAWVLSPLGIRILFQRGTFTAADTVLVTHLFRFGLFQLPFYFGSLVFVSLHSSHRSYLVLLASSILGLAMKALSIYLLLPSLGVGALVLSSAVVYAANAVLLAAMPAR